MRPRDAAQGKQVRSYICRINESMQVLNATYQYIIPVGRMPEVSRLPSPVKVFHRRTLRSACKVFPLVIAVGPRP